MGFTRSALVGRGAGVVIAGFANFGVVTSLDGFEGRAGTIVLGVGLVGAFIGCCPGRVGGVRGWAVAGFGGLGTEGAGCMVGWTVGPV